MIFQGKLWILKKWRMGFDKDYRLRFKFLIQKRSVGLHFKKKKKQENRGLLFHVESESSRLPTDGSMLHSEALES